MGEMEGETKFLFKIICTKWNLQVKFYLGQNEDLDHKQRWTPKIWSFWTVVLEKTLENPLDWKEIKPVNPKANQSWIFIGRTDAEAETPIIWPPDAKN